MAKKNAKKETVVETPAPQPVAQATQPEVAEAKPEVVFTVAKPDFTPARGFETVLFTELKNGPGSAAQLVDRLLKSGEFQRVAPKAAELRPAKPVKFLLKQWAAQGIATAA